MQPTEPAEPSSIEARIGLRIAQRREALGLPAHDLARRLEMSVSAWLAVERGEAAITVAVLCAAAEVLQTAPSALMGESGAGERFLLGLDQADTQALLQAFAAIAAQDVRAAIVGLVQEMGATTDFRPV